MKPQNRLVEFANSSFGFWTCFLGGLGRGGGDDDDIVTQTPRTLSPEEPFHSVFTDFRDVGPLYIVTKPTLGRCELDLGILEGFRQKLEIGWGGKLFRG